MTGGQVALHILSGAAAIALAIVLWASARGFSRRRGAEAQGGEARHAADREASAPLPCRIGAPLLLATAWGAGHVARLGEPAWNAGENQALWMALAALPLAVIAELGSRGSVLRSLALSLLLSGAFAYLVVIEGVRSEWRDGVFEPWIAGFAIGFAGFAFFLAALGEGSVARGFSWPARLMVSAGAVGGIALLSRYAKLTESAAVLAAILIPSVVVLLLARKARLGAGASLVAAAVLASFLAGAFLQTVAIDRAPNWAFVLVASSLLASALDAPRRKRPSRWRDALRWTIFAGLSAAGILLAIYAEAKESHDPELDKWMEMYEE